MWDFFFFWSPLSNLLDQGGKNRRKGTRATEQRHFPPWVTKGWDRSSPVGLPSRDRTPEEAGEGAFRREGPGMPESNPRCSLCPCSPHAVPHQPLGTLPRALLEPPGCIQRQPKLVRQLAHVRKNVGPHLHSPSGHSACSSPEQL